MRTGSKWAAVGLTTLVFASTGWSAPLSMQQVNQAQWKPRKSSGGTADPALVKAQVLLDRAFFSPGEIDGLQGDNVKKALRVFQAKHGLRSTGKMDQQTWKALNGADAAPALIHYTVTRADVNGPFTRKIPQSSKQAAKLPRLSYTSSVELISETFHMSPLLLKQLNPGANFKKAGTRLVVTNVGGRKPQGKAAQILVEKQTQTVRVYDKEKQLLALYPATIGSGDFPSPTGNLKVVAIANYPPHVLTPKLEYAKVKKGTKIRVPPGPNNPIGAVWIDLNKDGYGIHGSPEPSKVSKTASHGCVRLTNWDARELARLVQPGTPVRFSDG